MKKQGSRRKKYMGYQANLSFERYFVAEGVEMLNRFELPDEIAGLTEVHTA